ncbi:MAG TPA: DUF6580 family putative transport protein [Phycisphaerae bacterium]|nr:DUF6580 family putative transport protein [Phycisphaerae bacterium]
MLAYALILVAVLTRVLPHAGWWNFTAVTGGLLFFGARRPWREMLLPVAVLIAADFYLTAFVYHYPFQWQAYVITWMWYAMAIVLGQILLRARTTFVRGAAAAILGPTSFFVVSNFSVWASGFNGYPHTVAGLAACYMAGVPFYRNDLISTSLVLAGAVALEALLHRIREPRAGVALAGK